jgi:hypothetical protein
MKKYKVKMILVLIIFQKRVRNTLNIQIISMKYRKYEFKNYYEHPFVCLMFRCVNWN